VPASSSLSTGGSNVRLSILLLADDQKGHPNTIHDHIQAFRRHSRHRVELYNPRGIARSRFLDLNAFDVVVVHYSIVVIWDDYLAPSFREQIAAFDGLKVQFLQDEYRWVDDITAEMRRLGIDVLFSVVPEPQWAPIYGTRLPKTEILPTLTGYVAPALAARTSPALERRPIDVGYRGRSTPMWLGRLGFEKIEIGRGFLARAQGTDLRCDIAWTEGARIHGEQWNEFISSCRTMLASESGSSLVDFDGSIERATRQYIAAHPAAGYEEVERSVLARFEDGPEIKSISPRVFEAAASRTAMVMFPGEYSDIVEPWTHYIPLDKDFSNFDEVAARIRDVRFLETLTGRAHSDLIASGRYSEQTWIHDFDDAVAARADARGRLGSYPARRLALEQLSAGRSYHVSTLYGVARELILGYVGARATLRRPELRKLVRRALRRNVDAATSMWDDVSRLAILTSIQTGSLVPAGAPFEVVGDLDRGSGRLTLTSRTTGDTRTAPPTLERDVEEALRTGELREIVWNHAGVGQYVTLSVPPVPKRISFDVGRYDAYGVYRFEFVSELGRRDPQLVLAALRPLLRPRPHSHSDYRSRPHSPPTDANEADT
jgi:hypothetical protein